MRSPGSLAAGAWGHRHAFLCLLACCALPLVALLLAHRLWIRRKGLVGMREKLSGRGPACLPGQVLVHGVSLGEVNLMKPLLPRLETALGRRCLLSTSTETGRQRLDTLFPERERVFWPLDLPWAVEAFLRRTRPSLVILLELEIWPLMLSACVQRGIPVVLMNARVSERSYRGYQRAGPLLRPLFRSFALALAQNGTWGARLAALGCRTVRVSGSMKADMVQPTDASKAEEQRIRLGLDARPMLLLASTSPNEELPLLRSWLRWGARWRLVICPRHPERGSELAALCAQAGVPSVRSSLGPLPAPADQSLIVDEIGRLSALYRLCADTGGLAIVGGSLGSGRGGQNMLEAAAAGCCTVVGWDTRNFPDAMALLRLEGGVVELAADRIDQELERLAADPDRRNAHGAAGRRAWEAGKGATGRAVSLLAQLACRS